MPALCSVGMTCLEYGLPRATSWASIAHALFFVGPRGSQPKREMLKLSAVLH